MKKLDDATILRIYLKLKQGKTLTQVAKEVGSNKNTVWKYANKYGIKNKHFTSQCLKYDKEIRKLVEENCGYREIARKLNLDRNSVRDYCKRHLNYYSQAKATTSIPQSKDDVSDKISKQNPDVEYIDGYKNYYSKVNVRFKTCGHYKTVTYFASTTKNLVCLECAKKEREIKRNLLLEVQKNERQRNKLIRDFKRLLLKRIKNLDKKQQTVEIVCSHCGNVFVSNHKKAKYCSDICRKKMHQRNKDAVRRLRIKNGMVDKDISLKRLYDKYNGICAICGKPTDWNDCEWKGKVFYAGYMYPSHDHIKPVSKGGKQSWENAQLVHRYCNTLKGDKYDQITMEKAN